MLQGPLLAMTDAIMNSESTLKNEHIVFSSTLHAH